MWRGLWGTVALLALSIGIGAPSAPADAGGCAGEDRPVQNSQDAAAGRAAVLCLIDQERASRGLPALLPDDHLEIAAQGHSQDMVSRNYFAHTAPDPSPAGSTADARARSAGYDVQLVRENLAGGLPVPRDLVLGWLASEHHCETLLDPDVMDVGLGVVVGAFDGTPGPAWTLLAGTERSAIPPDGDGRPAAGCPYSALGIGQRPADPAPAPPAAAPKPAATGPGDGATRPSAAAAAPIAAPAPGPSLPQAAVRGLRVRWVDGLLQISGTMRPAIARHRVVIRVQRGKRRLREVTRTRASGAFARLLVVRPDAKGGTVKVTLAGVPEQLRTLTATRRLPKTAEF